MIKEGLWGPESLVRRNVRTLVPYEAREIPAPVKLDANESPFPFPFDPGFLKTIKTNRYPDPEAKALRKVFARTVGLKETKMVLHGNGSDELIYNLVCTFGGPVVFPTPTFSMYGTIAKAIGVPALGIPLRADFSLDTGIFLKTMVLKKPKLIFLSSPNNPTGNSFGEDDIIAILKASTGIVVVDEAYQPFSSRKSFIPMIGEYPNLAVLRTLSKIGLAALRVGFLVGSPGLISEVNKVRLPFNLNSFSQAVAAEALRQRSVLAPFVKAIVTERKRLFKGLASIRQIKPFPSDANFILFRVEHPGHIFKGLLEEGVLVRNMGRAVPGCLRVTVGTTEENDRFLDSIIKVIKKVAG